MAIQDENRRILIVDDEANLLAAMDRQLGDDYELTLALGPVVALQKVSECEQFAVVVADMRMPVMDGVQLLSKIKVISPITVRMMLTGNADQDTAVQAVNDGAVFRFLTKPVAPDLMRRAVDDALSQHRLVNAERELLEKTLGGSVRVLVEILAMIDPVSFGASQRLKERAGILGRALGIADVWQLELAAMLCQIGSVAIPSTHIVRSAGQGACAYDADIFSRIPIIGAGLIAKIPRLEDVAEAVKYQDKRFNGKGVPDDTVYGENIPLHARVLKVLKDLARSEATGLTPSQSMMQLEKRASWYDPAILKVAVECFAVNARLPKGRELRVHELRAGHVLAVDLATIDGLLLAKAGFILTDPFIARLWNYGTLELISEPILVQGGEEKAAA